LVRKETLAHQLTISPISNKRSKVISKENGVLTRKSRSEGGFEKRKGNGRMTSGRENFTKKRV